MVAAFPAVTHSEFREQTRPSCPGNPVGGFPFLHGELKFDLLVDVTCVDICIFARGSIGLGWCICWASTDTNERITCGCIWTNRTDVPSARAGVAGADWLEPKCTTCSASCSRPSGLRRILMPDDSRPFPLRKDYQRAMGRGERHNSPC